MALFFQDDAQLMGIALRPAAALGKMNMIGREQNPQFHLRAEYLGKQNARNFAIQTPKEFSIMIAGLLGIIVRRRPVRFVDAESHSLR